MSNEELKSIIESEGDYRFIMSNGFPCVIRRVKPMLHLCGYVGVPEGHPFFGKSYMDIHNMDPEIYVHGGLTFSNNNEELEPSFENYWWIGFDTAHFMDLVPGMFFQMPNLIMTSAVYRDMEYMEDQVRGLAKRVSEYEREHGEPRED